MSILKERMAKFAEVDVYPVVSPGFCLGRDLIEVLKAILEGGAKIVQLRMKDASAVEVAIAARAFRRETEAAGALLIINDYLEVALGEGADGVHLGLDDKPVAEAAATAPDLIIGASSHSEEEALAAERWGASYVNIGPLFPTSTKNVPIPPLGLDTLGRIAPRLGVPFTVMGGIKRQHIPELAAAGATKIAMVTEITEAEDVASRVREIRATINDSKARALFRAH